MDYGRWVMIYAYSIIFCCARLIFILFFDCLILRRYAGVIIPFGRFLMGDGACVYGDGRVLPFCISTD